MNEKWKAENEKDGRVDNLENLLKIFWFGKKPIN